MLKLLSTGRQRQAQRVLRAEEGTAGFRLSWRWKMLLAAILGFLVIYSQDEDDNSSSSLLAHFGEDNVVAYAITLTNCSQSTVQQHYVVDAAAVLKHSIHLVSRQTPASQSRYDYQMYAFVHEHVRDECAPVVPALQRLGYNVQWKSTPFSLDQIHNPILKEKIHKQGCCEEKEFLKLYTLQLTQHPVAAHLDLDTLVLKRLDHLYDAMLYAPSAQDESRRLVHQHTQPHNAENDASKESLPNNIRSYFTRDYNMAMPGTRPSRVGMQGGFWIVRPSQATFEDIVSLVVDHGVQYGTSCGWGGCKIGRARFYGGAGFQGVISYYYAYFFSGNYSNGVAKVDLPPPEPQFVELNRCLYNSMADKARKACNLDKGDVAACNHCNETDFKELYGAHFTLCQKPWLCGAPADQQLCYRLHNAWHAIREDFVRQQTGNELYDPEPGDLSSRKRYVDRIVGRFPKQCAKRGAKGYVPIGLLESSGG